MAALSLLAPQRLRTLPMLEWSVLSFVYWVVFMGALAPGNIRHDLDAGAALDWGGEIIRLIGAGILGASATPALLFLSRCAPLGGAHTRRNLIIQAGAILALSVLLIVASCFAAAWILEGRTAPSATYVEAQLFANVLLVFFCQSLLLAAIAVAPRVLNGGRQEWPERLTIGERGRAIIVDLTSVEWIEAQGNYQALHTDAGVHLLRSTSAEIETKLNPSRFLRIHRRSIVALDRIQRVEPLPSGDAVVVMKSGARVRQARQYRNALRSRLAE